MPTMNVGTVRIRQAVAIYEALIADWCAQPAAR
jgi:hypothetical protein